MARTFKNGFCFEMIEKNNFLRRDDITLCWRYNYIPFHASDNSVDNKISKYICTLKNTYNKDSLNLHEAAKEIEKDINEGLGILLPMLAAESQPWVVVAAPRSKAEFYEKKHEKQLYLIKAISNAVSKHRVENGAYFIKRDEDTKTTHLMNTKNGDMNTTGKAPYPGITRDTCSLHGDVRGKNVILIDDIYTHGVNVDEDCVQFLFDNGARKVVLYTLCKT
ncbi:MAG: hypothetical protein K2G25_01750 [Oscillospiraceae bacterium]|nr:hypothetical protein [Oscillospiraceae bacterium]